MVHATHRRLALALVIGLLCAARPARSDPPATPPLPFPIPSAWLPQGLPVVPAQGLPAPRVEFRQVGDVGIRGGGAAPRVSLLDHEREHAWFSPNGTIVTSGGMAGSLIAGGRTMPLGFADGSTATFSPDGRGVALLQARAPASIVSLPDGRVAWQHQHGIGCAARWASASVLLLLDTGADARLWRVDVGTTSFTVTQVGGPRRVNRCWATPDGSQWLVDDGTNSTSVVDGRTGSSSPLVSGYSNAIVGSPVGNRVCFEKDNAISCKTAWPPRDEFLIHGGDLAFGAIDETGARLLFEVHGTTFVADFASQTVFAVPGARLIPPGWLTIVAGGHVIAGGSNTGTYLYNLDAGTQSFVPGALAWSVFPAPGRWKSVLSMREGGGKKELFLIDLP
jgi:hypothetical protein